MPALMMAISNPEVIEPHLLRDYDMNTDLPPITVTFRRVATYFGDYKVPAMHDGIFVPGAATDADQVRAILRAFDAAGCTMSDKGDLGPHWVASQPRYGKTGFFDGDLFGIEAHLREGGQVVLEPRRGRRRAAALARSSGGRLRGRPRRPHGSGRRVPVWRA